ncbi:hypothetical protein EDB85DRAFT_1889742 [Lactarius pseudohatsudake]|nr:hypothetical protein EDB85DRAFT_1889742 [Lactarius pseudohatsudake]
MATPSATALPVRIIVTANVETEETGIGTGTVAGGGEMTVNGTPPTASARIVATATGNVIGGNATEIVSVAAFVKKDAHALMRNVDESRAKTNVVAPLVTKRVAPHVVALPAEAAAANAMGGRPNAARPLPWRQRKASGWDVHAPGYEQYSAMQAKQTGLFNLPGANRTQIPPILAVPGLPPPMPVPTFGMGMAVNPNLSRQSRRLYIGSITPEINEQNLADFFNNKMTEMKIGTGAPGNPVLAVQCNYEKSYAFVEFRSAEDATAAMAFDGIMFLNGPLKIRRPKDYGGMEMTGPVGFHVPGVVSTNVPDSANKVFVGGLPSYLNEEQVMELLKSFGELKAFNLVRDNGTGPSKGFAFFEYVDAAVTDVAIAALSGMTLGDRQLVVQRASVGAKAGQPGFPDLPYEQFPEIPRPIMPAGDVSDNEARILLMLNMVTPDDLVDDDEYVEIVDDIRSEVSTYGAVEDIRIPRPAHGRGHHPSDQANGVGRVYVKFVDAPGAAAAMKALAGRSFAGRSIIATLLGEDSQTTPPLEVIFAPQPDAPPPLPQ